MSETKRRTALKDSWLLMGPEQVTWPKTLQALWWWWWWRRLFFPSKIRATY